MPATPPEPLPPGVRLAKPGDQAELLEMFIEGLIENGWGGYDRDEMSEVIAKATIGQDGIVIAVVDGATRIEGAIGFCLTKLWWGGVHDWYWTDLGIYVRKECRRSLHAHRLMKFGQWWGRQTDMPVVINLMPTWGFAEKTRFFQRYGDAVSVAFSVGKALRPTSETV